jgi:hypothetical protein
LEIQAVSNLVAHRLAQDAIRQRQCVVMRLLVPAWVQELVENEAPGRDVTDTSGRVFSFE